MTDDQWMPRALALAVLLVHALVLSALTLPATAAAAATPGSWRWPVDPPRSIARPYLAPATPYASGHRGIDITAPAGVLYAPADGVVHFSGVVVDRPVLSIGHGSGVISSYEPVIASVVEGDSVARGQVIGTVSVGHCASQCVHVGVRVDGAYVSPLAWFGGIPPSVLLPTRGSVAAVTAPDARRSPWPSRREPPSRAPRRRVRNPAVE